MKIILLKAVPRLGKPFDVVEVKDGYARNYLFPKKLAIPATPANLKGLKKNEERFSEHLQKIRRKSMDIAEQINNPTIKSTLKSDIEGKTFGSITSQTLVELLKQEGIEVDKKHIVLEEPIKQPGEYEIVVNLPQKVVSKFRFVLEKEGG